jgi:hypothetical protein
MANLNDKDYLEFQGTTFYVPNLMKWTKDQFKAKYKGLVNYDLDHAWMEIEKGIKEIERRSIPIDTPEEKAADIVSKKQYKGTIKKK